ncbi:proteasome inhibitor PI31 subunit isoform X2 [Hyperolius riggenbachi]|uniref:proteasome inhibitor PI31 subunit isoform X2 n=1 Tax=Hyperolius riggenbachi TaxID=752182 RepID=UPI0035A354FF
MEYPGLELQFALASPEFSQPQDVLVCFIHWKLISHGLHCLGTGEQAGVKERESELLPDGWASNKELYTLRYRKGQSLFLLKALTVDDTLIVNILEVNEEKSADLMLNTADFIDSSNLKNFHSVYKNTAELKQQLQTQLISPLLGTKEATWKPKKEQERTAEDDTLRVPTRNPRPYQPSWGHSGGMIFDPFHAGRTRPRPNPLPGLPPGAVPPGARFDPFGPPGTGRSGPDPDHLPPPGYDDMFM